SGDPAVPEATAGVRRFAIPRQLPRQLSRFRAKADQGPGSPDPAGPGTTSIVVVEASEVDDRQCPPVNRPAPDVNAPAVKSPDVEDTGDLEDTQEFPAITDEEFGD
ncbi:MAG TPA: hypothetical protein VNC22_19480, partial [Sporichthya sp.]|nr:hypothetical protein [Sporichthya sp.]